MTAADAREFDGFRRWILDRPDDAMGWMVAADWCADHGHPNEEQSLRSKRVPLDDWDVAACEALLALGLPGHFIQDVCRNVVAFGAERVTVDSERVSPLAAVLTDIRDRLSPKQLLWVWRLVLKYRRRIGRACLAERARELLPEGMMNEP
jgi:hypothetical protein